MKKERGTIIFLIFLILIILFYVQDGNNGMPRSPDSCFDMSDCAPRIEKYCRYTSLPCTFSTYYECVLQQDGSKCLPVNCSNECGPPCDHGCSNGECLDVNMSDLIIYNITNITNGEITDISILVKNIGFAPAQETKTSVANSDGVELELIDTPFIGPFETILLGPISFTFPQVNFVDLIIAADARDEIEEMNEENNELAKRIVILNP